MLKRSPLRAQVAALAAEITSAVRLTAGAVLLFLFLLILTLVPLNILLWELAL